MQTTSNTIPAPAPGGPGRNSGRSGAPDSNPFASLEQETTHAFQVSNELLEMARDDAAAASGATKAYEVPAELLEMARARKLAKQAAARTSASAPQTDAIPDVCSPSAAVESPIVPNAPQVTFSELSEEERTWIESAMAAPTPAAVDEHEGTVAYADVPPESYVAPTRASLMPAPQVRAAAPSVAAPKPKRMGAGLRFVLTTLSVIVLLAIGFQCVRVIQSLQSSSLKDMGGSERGAAPAAEGALQSVARLLR